MQQTGSLEPLVLDDLVHQKSLQCFDQIWHRSQSVDTQLQQTMTNIFNVTRQYSTAEHLPFYHALYYITL